MIQRSYALLPWMVITAAAVAQTRSADVLYTHFDDFPTHGLRVGDECFVALEDVTRWGWTTQAWADTVSVKAEGQSFDVPLRTINGRQCLPMFLAVKKLGGNAEWLDNTDTLSVYGTLSLVSARDGRLRVQSTLDFQPRATTLSNPTRLVVDFAGVRLDAKGTKLDLDPTARVVQFRPNVVRLVVETHSDIALDRLTGGSSHDLEALYRSPDTQVSDPEEPPPAPPPVEGPAPPKTVKPSPAPVNPSTLSIEVFHETEGELELNIPVRTSGGPLIEKPDASTLKITLPGVSLVAPSDYRVASLSVASVSSTVANNRTILVLTLARPMGAELVQGDDGIRIRLVKPNVGNGRLAGKLIVVDAGHGGTDKGASEGGILEKDLNLKIARLVAEGLTREGATVIMTRKTDVYIPLPVRGQIANHNHADLFISNHINTTVGYSGQSGSIVFHHKGNAISRVLAEAIDQELGKVSGIPNMGVWSDGRIYPHGGFAVLRETNMPGVLIEYGFINHARDRKRMVTDEFQQAVAAAVVRGIKVYLGDAKAN